MFTQEYGEKVARLLGWMNEFTNPDQPADEENMDFWNDAHGRKLGLTEKTRESLLQAVHRSLAAGDLIVSPNDPRRYSNPSGYRLDKNRSVIVAHEDLTGLNELFFDLVTNEMMSRDEFVEAISAGRYPGYRVAVMHGRPTPVSKADGSIVNNLE